MALYSFCIKKKNEPHFHRMLPDNKYDLQFLDFLTTHFNNKQELFKFLNLDDEVVDIAITYKHDGSYQKLNILYAGATELREVASSMVELDPNVQLNEEIANVGYGYLHSETVTCEKTVPSNTNGFQKIYREFLKDNRAKIAFRTNRLHRHAYESYMTFGDCNYLLNELCKSYLAIRKIYMSLVEQGRMYERPFSVKHSDISLRDIEATKKSNEDFSQVCEQESFFDKRGELINIHIGNDIEDRMNALIRRMNISDYDAMLVARVIRNDNDALEELMANDVEVLENFREFFTILTEYRRYKEHQGKQKRL